MTDLFFILGRGRSGTTLLSRMLTRHPDIVVAPEGLFAMSLRQRYARGAWDATRVDRFCADLQLEARMRRWRLDLEAIGDALRRRAAALDYAEACRVVYVAYAERTAQRSAPRWIGDKNPVYALLVDRLAQTFPAARFVHVVRDPRDNVCSFRNVAFDLDDVGALAERWTRYNDSVLRAQRAAPERFVRLCYEDLLADPGAELRRVCTFLEVPFDPIVLSFHEADDAGFYGRKTRECARLREPLDPGRSGRWRAELDERALGTIARACGALARELGYDLGPPADARHLALDAGRALGWASVAAERSIVTWLSPEAQSGLINLYRRGTERARAAGSRQRGGPARYST